MMNNDTRLIQFQKKILLGAFFFGVIFLGGKVLSERFFSVATSLVEIEQEIAQQDTAAGEVNPELFHKTAVKYAKKTNNALELYRNDETKDAVIWFYTHVTDNEFIASTILEHANTQNISPSLAFALAYEESRYSTQAVNNNGTSLDRGLFQLNNKSFPYLTEKEFFDPVINAKYAMQHLRYCIETAGNEVSALAMYNAGATKVRNNNTPQRTLDYVSRIIAYKQGLDELFDTEVASLHKTQLQSEEKVQLAKF